MTLAEGISKHGFRKWYERELMRSHGHLVLLIACAIGLLTSFSVYSSSAPWSERALDVAAIVLFATVGQWSLRRFFFLLMHAESVANQAVCSACQTYGRLTLAQGSGGRAESLLVCCKKCAHEWAIND
jgi:hypothetical protein